MNNLRIFGIPVKIQMAHLPNASKKNYASANLVRPNSPLCNIYH